MLTPPPSPALREIVARALHEDFARGDITTEACIPVDALASARMVARAPLVFAGAPIVREVFRQLDDVVRVTPEVDEGATVAPGAALITLEGPTRTLLSGERVALNLVQRVAAVATHTRHHVDALTPGSKTRIADTRKTTPGLRAIERYAVRAGGAHNHREDLSSAVLIKDNHIAAAGGVGPAIRAAQAYAPHSTRIECEVDTFAQLDEALEAGADIIMLDNFDDDAVDKAIARVAGRAILEASGGITLSRIASLSALGVDVISIGALTHSAPSVDIGLDWGEA